MIIKVLVTYVAMDEPYIKEHTVDIPEDASLQDVFDALGCGLADVSDYYELSGVFAWNNFYCPFILTECSVQYNLPYNEVKVSDFIHTHCIGNNSIRIATGYPQAGGPGFVELKEIWDTIYPWLNDIAILCTITGISVKGIIDGIRSYFEHRKASPHAVIDMLATRRQWNHKELAEILEMPEKNALYLLKAFGYEYDKKLMLYVPSKNTVELREKIKSVQIHDI